jgi:outer membrane biosynthesis protein TonB
MTLASTPYTPGFGRLLTALLVSALLHVGLAWLPGRGDDSAAGAGTPAPASHLLTARLLPPPPRQTRAPKPTPPAPAPVPADPAQPQASAPTAATQETPRVPLPSRGAYPLGPVNLDIPEARLPTVQGTVVIKLWVDEQGRVTAFEAEPTELPTEYVTAVGETLSEVRFAPALKEGQPVASVLRLEISAEAAQTPP